MLSIASFRGVVNSSCVAVSNQHTGTMPPCTTTTTTRSFMFDET